MICVIQWLGFPGYDWELPHWIGHGRPSYRYRSTNEEHFTENAP